ncbi:hypothetical protein BTA51_13990 [Hahella sp. CCB-MM4]|nr:hypothetical protein BTA51_13990 [Hahella sp. CCB-MM4]
MKAFSIEDYQLKRHENNKNVIDILDDLIELNLSIYHPIDLSIRQPGRFAHRIQNPQYHTEKTS